MKTPIIVLVMFAVYSFAGDLSTRTGHTYRNVELVSHDVFSAKIKHSAGVAVVRYAEMNDADKTLYGYDAAAENKALDARKAAEAAKKAAEEKALVEKKEREEKETKRKSKSSRNTTDQRTKRKRGA